MADRRLNDEQIRELVLSCVMAAVVWLVCALLMRGG
jgi:hypothetical protein